MSQSITAREWSSNCFPEAVKKLLKCYSSSSLYQEGVWGAASKFEECCWPKWIKQFVNDYYVNQMSLLRTRYRYRSTITGTFLSLSRENALKISGQLVLWKGKKRQEKREKCGKKLDLLGICQRSVWQRLKRLLARYVLCIGKYLSPFTGSQCHEMRFILILTHAAYHTG